MKNNSGTNNEPCEIPYCRDLLHYSLVFHLSTLHKTNSYENDFEVISNSSLIFIAHFVITLITFTQCLSGYLPFNQSRMYSKTIVCLSISRCKIIKFGVKFKKLLPSVNIFLICSCNGLTLENEKEAKRKWKQLTSSRLIIAIWSNASVNAVVNGPGASVGNSG